MPRLRVHWLAKSFKIKSCNPSAWIICLYNFIWGQVSMKYKRSTNCGQLGKAWHSGISECLRKIKQETLLILSQRRWSKLSVQSQVHDLTYRTKAILWFEFQGLVKSCEHETDEMDYTRLSSHLPHLQPLSASKGPVQTSSHSVALRLEPSEAFALSDDGLKNSKGHLLPRFAFGFSLWYQCATWNSIKDKGVTLWPSMNNNHFIPLTSRFFLF